MNCINDNIVEKYSTLGSYTIFDDSDYLSAVHSIWEALNYNDVGSVYNPLNLFSLTVTTNEVDDILNTYMKVINNTSLPEYDDTMSTSQDSIKLFKAIAIQSKRNIELVKRVLKQLYWYTKQGVIKTTGILHPRTTNTKSSDYENTSPVGKLINGVGATVKGAVIGTGSLLEGTGKLLKYLPYMVIIGGTAYVIYNVKNMKDKK